MSVSSWLSTTIESSGIAATFRFSMDFSGLPGLWAKATKGTAKKARTINANIFFIIHFLLSIINVKSPSRAACVKNVIGELYVVNSLYTLSREINTNYACGCITPRFCINPGGDDSRINCYQGLKVVRRPLLRLPLPREVAEGLRDVSRNSHASCGYIVS